jgi:DNA-binding transcriptional ArsR family regulator
MSQVRSIDGCTTSCVHPERVEAVRALALGEVSLERVASIFKLLGDPTRTRLLYALLEAGEMCVCDLAAATDVTEATTSQALRLLRATSVVAGRREGRMVYYRLADAHVRLLLELTREHAQHADGAPIERPRGGAAQSVAASQALS